MTEAIPAFNVVDLFSGVGGLTLGFQEDRPAPQWRFRTRVMVDNDPEARSVANRNFPAVPFFLADGFARTAAGDEPERYGVKGADPIRDGEGVRRKFRCRGYVFADRPGANRHRRQLFH